MEKDENSADRFLQEWAQHDAMVLPGGIERGHPVFRASASVHRRGCEMRLMGTGASPALAVVDLKKGLSAVFEELGPLVGGKFNDP